MAGSSDGSPDKGKRVGETYGWFLKGVLCIFRPHKIFVLTACSEETGELLVQTFSLPIRLWVITGCKADVDIEEMEEG